MTAIQQTVDGLRSLRLTAMAEAYQRQLENPEMRSFSFDERLALLVENEMAQRTSRKLKRLVASAKMPEMATLEEVEFGTARGLDKPLVMSLGQCDFIRRNLNVIIVRPTGVGKSYLACALGTEACRQRLAVSFRNVNDLLEEISGAEADGSTSRLKSALSKPDLLILDDLGVGTISEHAAQILLSVIDRRMRKSSLIITSQWPTEAWHGFFPNPTIADAILDRVVHASHKIAMGGESMRKKQAKKRLGK